MPPSFRHSVTWLVGLSVIVLALAGGLLGTIAVEPFCELMYGNPLGGYRIRLGVVRTKSLVFLLCTAVCTTLLLAVALIIGLDESQGVKRRTFLSCSFLGWLNSATSMSLAAFADGPSEAVTAFFVGFCIGPFIGLPLGALYGGVCLFATRRLRRLLDRPTVTAQLAVQQTVGQTILVASGIGLSFSFGTGAELTLWIAPVLALFGAVLTGHALIRLKRIARFARNPDDAHHLRVPLEVLGAPTDALLPLDEDTSCTAAYALVWVIGRTGGGAYRGGPMRLPLALVD